MSEFVKPEMLPAKEVRAMIAGAVKTVLQGQNEVQRAAEHALLHAAEYGDVTLLKDLVTGLSDRGDGKEHPYCRKVTLWVKANAPILIKGNGNWGLRGKDAPEYKPFTLEAAFACPFWMMETPAAGKVLNVSDVIALIKGPLKTLTKAADDGRVNMGEADILRHKAALEAAMALYGRMVGLASDAPAKPSTAVGLVVATSTPVDSLEDGDIPEDEEATAVVEDGIRAA